MARPRFYLRVKRVNVTMESALCKAAKKRAKELGLPGGLSDYISRLLIRNLRQQGRSIENTTRRFRPNNNAVS